MLRRLASRGVARTGLHVHHLEPGAWLVQSGGDDGRRLVPERIGRRGWVLRRSGADPVRVQRVGGRASGTSLVYAPKAARAHMHAVQRNLSRWLLQEQLIWTLDALGVDVVLDVGANVGQYATRLRRSGYRGRIVSFEPVARTVARLREASAGDPLWDVHPYALGEEDGTAEILSTPGRTLSSLLPASEFGRGWSTALEHPVAETIQVRRLESVLDEVLAGVTDPRIFLKLDTQGYDLPAVRGAGSRLEEVVGLQSELACLPLYEGVPVLEEHLAEYRRAGFDVAGMYPVSREGSTLRIIEFDVVMVRAEEFARADRT